MSKTPWDNGAWWPIYVLEWWSPSASRHPLDPYSFVNLQTGVVLFFACHYPLTSFLGEEMEMEVTIAGFMISLAFSLILKIIENEGWVIEKYREASGTSSDYDGDSYQNIIGDLIMSQGWG